ncbi:MAG: hypothetical protein HC772_17875 [Leptolyngbyaceae cyanobacterium CRU_2_3]|nr:hypothetical protein [Leptolyngbyaceae cyanobacterium CRU_2_3]
MRRSLLDPIMLQDPQLHEFEDWCFLWHLAQRTPLHFSYALTYETRSFPTTQPSADRSLLQTFQDWSSELSRLKFIFWHQEFAPGKTLQSVQQTYREQQQLRAKVNPNKRSPNVLSDHLTQLAQLQDQVQAAQAQIESMKTSKFWQMRSAWFRLKRAIGWPVEAE